MTTASIVVPCYNEAQRLRPDAFLAALDAQPELELVFCDDGSADATPAILHSLRSRRPERIQLVRLPHNQGKAEAVRRGMVASMQGAADYIGYWDADLSTPLEAIPELRAHAEQSGALLVMAARWMALGRQIERNPLRHYAGRVFATLASQVLQLPVYDTQCGAKLFVNCQAVQALFAERFSTNWVFDVEILARLRRDHTLLDGSVVEFPLERWADHGGSKVRPRDLLSILRDLWRIRRRYPIPSGRPR